MARASKREDVLDTADVLFEKNGFVATGVNQITQEAGVASMTLYNNFASKDDLIVASLERRAAAFREQVAEIVQNRKKSPENRILSLFDALDGWIASDIKEHGAFRGCYFVKASVEFTASEHPAHQAAAVQKRDLIGLIAIPVREMGRRNPDALANELHLLFEGAMIQAQVLGDADSAKRARRMAKRLLKD